MEITINIIQIIAFGLSCFSVGLSLAVFLYNRIGRKQQKRRNNTDFQNNIDFGDCTKCKYSLQIAEHKWECTSAEYDIDAKVCWEPRENEMK